MANTCENILIIEGSRKEINRFKQFVGDDFVQGFSKEKLFLITEDMCKSCTIENEVEEVWGSTAMWNVKVSISDKKIIVEYNTDWNTNSVFVESLSAQFPKLQFELLYADGGFCFGGSYSVKNGEGCAFTPPLYQVYFVKEMEADNYLFIVDYETAKKYPICNYFVVPGLDWKTICAVKGYSSHNVKNWEVVVNYGTDKIKQVFDLSSN